MGKAKTMKAAVVRAFGKPLVIEELPVPEPKANEILVKMESTGVCHTDLHAVEGDWPIKPSPPFIPGHEGVGYVAAAGRDVKNVKEGDLVGTPDEVTDRLRGLQDELGIDGILAELNCGGLVPHRQVMTALQLLCQEVMPRFH